MQTTWNIIFFGVNLSHDTAMEDNETKTIIEGIEIFKADVKKSVYSDFLKITLLEFLSPKDIDKATIYKNENRAGKNNMEPIKHLDFNCYPYEVETDQGKTNKNDYEDFIKSCVSTPLETNAQKYIVIFLAHSFGGGFLYGKKDKNLLTSEDKYLSTSELSDAIENGFGNGRKADCFLALNCSLQSVQTNCIFSPAAHYLIGSQQPLHIKAVCYQPLLADLIYSIKMHNGNFVGHPEEIIYTKFIYDCYANFKAAIKYNAIKGIEIFDNFCLSLTKPAIANTLDVKINAFAKLIDKNLEKLPGNIDVEPIDKNPEKLSANTDFDYFNFSARFCEDPSYLDRVNIVDAKQFFLKLKTYYLHKSDKWLVIEEILNWLNRIVLLNVSSTDICLAEVDEDGSARMYLPMGIGIIAPKVLSKHILTIIQEMPKYQKAFGDLITILIGILDKPKKDLPS